MSKISGMQLSAAASGVVAQAAFGGSEVSCCCAGTREVSAGPAQLSGRIGWPPPPRQSDVMKLIACGLTNKEIALDLGCSGHTVASYLKLLFRRFGVHSRTGLAAEWWRHDAAPGLSVAAPKNTHKPGYSQR